MKIAIEDKKPPKTGEVVFFCENDGAEAIPGLFYKPKGIWIDWHYGAELLLGDFTHWEPQHIDTKGIEDELELTERNHSNI